MSDAPSPSSASESAGTVRADDRRRRRELIAIGVLGCVLALLGGIAFSLLTASVGSSGRTDPAPARATAASSQGRPPSATPESGSGSATTVDPGAATTAVAGDEEDQSVETGDPATAGTPTTSPAGVALVSAGGNASPTTVAPPPPTTPTTASSPPTTAAAAPDGAADEPAP
ncbi:MAG: hypothetical protein JNK12_11280 [Acidimicrobiales bacterium]|nr:hypothetical protein [Acidimicrobiales bacterium]